MPPGTFQASKSDVSNDDFKALIAAAPVAALFYASDGGFPSYSSGVFSCSTEIYASDLNHAVTVVGYDSDGNYIIKNSWGKSWGTNGFGVVNKDPAKNCGINIRVYYFAGASPTNNNGTNFDNNNNNSINFDGRVFITLIACFLFLMN